MCLENCFIENNKCIIELFIALSRLLSSLALILQIIFTYPPALSLRQSYVEKTYFSLSSRTWSHPYNRRKLKKKAHHTGFLVTHMMMCYCNWRLLLLYWKHLLFFRSRNPNECEIDVKQHKGTLCNWVCIWHIQSDMICILCCFIWILLHAVLGATK